MFNDDQYDSEMESASNGFSERDWMPRNDDEDEIDPDSLAEWEDSDGDTWRAYVDGKHIVVCCVDCEDGDEVAFGAVCTEDMREFRRFLRSAHAAFLAIPDDVKENLRQGR